MCVCVKEWLYIQQKFNLKRAKKLCESHYQGCTYNYL